MVALSQNYWIRLKDRVARGEITVEESHVEQVRAARVYLVTCPLPADFRRALNAAVKSEKLGHVKKEGHKPEAYFHPEFAYLVPGERKAVEDRALRAIRGVIAIRGESFEDQQ